MDKVTKEQGIVITGYTGFMCCNFGDFHADVERRLGHSVWTHQFASPELKAKLKEIYRADFLALCAADTPQPSPAVQAGTAQGETK